MWDLPGPGLEHVSPALAGGFLTTAPPGKSKLVSSLLSTEIISSQDDKTDYSVLIRSFLLGGI